MTPVYQTGYGFVVKWCSPLPSLPKECQHTHFDPSLAPVVSSYAQLYLFVLLSLSRMSSIPGNSKTQRTLDGNLIGYFSLLIAK